MTRATILTDWCAPDGTVVGVTVRDGVSLASSYVCTDLRFDCSLFESRLESWIARTHEAGLRLIDLRGVTPTETVTLHDGPEDQHLVPGVAPVPLTVRQLAVEAQRRAARRGDAPLPAGGLFDDTARLQQDLFA